MIKMLDELINLQREQLDHDERAHKDILCLSTKNRITHMTLHFAKYVGTLAEASSKEKFQRVVLDAFIIALASGNCLNTDLGSQISKATGARSLKELATVEGITEASVSHFLFTRLATTTGLMAKACESLDHQEKGDWRAVLEFAVVRIASGVLATIHMLDLDIYENVRARWREVEAKSIFNQLSGTPNSFDNNSHMILMKTG